MTRAEHLQWAKDRAVAYLPGSVPQAVASFLSDLGKWQDPQGGSVVTSHRAIDLGTCPAPGNVVPRRALDALLPLVVFEVQRGDVEGVRRWIEGFN